MLGTEAGGVGTSIVASQGDGNMSACETCRHDGGDPGNAMIYVHCLAQNRDRIIQRPLDCEYYESEDEAPEDNAPLLA